MKKQENYKIVFSNENNSKVIFAISKLVNYLEQFYKDKENITVIFTSINYSDDENNQKTNKFGEISLQVTMNANVSSDDFKGELNSIINEIQIYYKLDEIVVKEIN